MRRAELRAGPPGREIAATLYLPDRSLPLRPVLMFAAPGRGHGRGYFDLQLDRRQGYSQAEHHTDAGLIVLAYDDLGVGDSGLEDLDGLTIEEAAAIEVPVLMAFGERDVSEDPRAERPPFRKAIDITVFIAPRLAHMQNFASTRDLLGDRMVCWRRELAA